MRSIALLPQTGTGDASEQTAAVRVLRAIGEQPPCWCATPSSFQSSNSGRTEVHRPIRPSATRSACFMWRVANGPTASSRQVGPALFFFPDSTGRHKRRRLPQTLASLDAAPNCRLLAVLAAANATDAPPTPTCAPAEAGVCCGGFKPPRSTLPPPQPHGACAAFGFWLEDCRGPAGGDGPRRAARSGFGNSPSAVLNGARNVREFAAREWHGGHVPWGCNYLSATQGAHSTTALPSGED